VEEIEQMLSEFIWQLSGGMRLPFHFIFDTTAFMSSTFSSNESGLKIQDFLKNFKCTIRLLEKEVLLEFDSHRRE
jgi:hypothetical protein